MASNKVSKVYTDIINVIREGRSAQLLDHDTFIRTSSVVSYDETTGRIETLNSGYLPIDED